MGMTSRGGLRQKERQACLVGRRRSLASGGHGPRTEGVYCEESSQGVAAKISFPILFALEPCTGVDLQMAARGASLKFVPSEEPCRDSVLETIAATVAAVAERDGWDESLAFKVNFVLEELATNILAYGGEPDRPSPDIEIDIASRGDALVIEVSDDGRPFDPLRDAPPAPVIDENTDVAPIGGMGLHLVLRMVESIAYRYENGRNRVTMVARRD